VPQAGARGLEARSAQFATTSVSAARIRRSCSVLQRGGPLALRRIGTKKIHRAGCAFVHIPREPSASAYGPRELLRPTRAPCSVQEQPNPPARSRQGLPFAKSAHFAHRKLSTFPRPLRAPGEKSVDISARPETWLFGAKAAELPAGSRVPKRPTGVRRRYGSVADSCAWLSDLRSTARRFVTTAVQTGDGTCSV
jgi:hypothetical protein